MRHYIPRSILWQGLWVSRQLPELLSATLTKNNFSDVAKFCLTITEDAQIFAIDYAEPFVCAATRLHDCCESPLQNQALAHTTHSQNRSRSPHTNYQPILEPKSHCFEVSHHSGCNLWFAAVAILWFKSFFGFVDLKQQRNRVLLMSP